MAFLSQPFRRSWVSRLHIHSNLKASSTHRNLTTATDQTAKKPLRKAQSYADSSIAMSADAFLSAVKARRTYYQLDSSSTISDERIQELLNQVILNTPSAFNSQTTRALLLLGDEHKKLWNDITKPAVKAVAPAEAWPASDQKLTGFANAYGTVSAPDHYSMAHD